MIDWNNNGKIDPVDVGISIAISQDNETDEARNVEEKRLSLLDKLMNWIKNKRIYSFASGWADMFARTGQFECSNIVCTPLRGNR